MALLTVSATLLGSLVNLGVNNAMHRFYFDPATAEADRPAIVSTGLAQLLCSSLIVVGLTFLLLAGFRDEMLRDYDIEWLWAALVLANIIPEQIAQYSLDAVRLHFTPWRFFFIALVKNLLGILLGLWFLTQWEMGLAGIFLGTLAASSAAAPLGLWLIRRDLTLRLDRRVGRAIFAFGYPFVFASAAYWVFGSMDRWLLMEMSDVEQVGLFSTAFKFAAVIGFVITAFAQAWSPHAMKMMREDPQYRRTFATIFSAWYFFLAMIGLFIALFAEEAMILLARREYWPAAPILSVGAAGMVLYGTTQITALGITLEKRTMLLTAGAWIAAIVNVALNLLLIPRFGALGSAAATLFAYAALTGSFLIWTQRLHPLPLERGKLLYSTLLVAAAVAAPFVFSLGRIDPAAVAAKLFILLLAAGGAFAVHIVPRALTRQMAAMVRG
jgi:O-antigen/teichoic acid export membrane protein